jgi:hypothetical protein
MVHPQGCLGPTTTNIRVPATYHYHIELAREWKVRVRPDRTVIVVAPAVKPTLPIAIDTARLERNAEGRWSLLTGTSELYAPGALRDAAREIHDLSPLTRSDVISGTASTRARTSTTVAIAEVERADQCRIFIGAGLGRRGLRPGQRRAMVEYGITIARGRLHAELNIRDNLPPGSRVIRWGISWAGNQRPEPCAECEPEVRRLGGRIEDVDD